MIDARAVILRKNFTAESVGGREDGGHRRYGGSGGRSWRGRGREEWPVKELRGKKTTEGNKLDGGHVYFLFQPSLNFGEKIQKEIILQPLRFCAFPFFYLARLWTPHLLPRGGLHGVP